MKKTFKTIFSVMMMGCATAGQAQNWTAATEEAFPVGGGACTPWDATTTGIGGYVAGQFSGTTNFGSTALTSSGGSDAFLTRLNSTTGVSIWAIKASSTGGDAFKKVEAAGGDVYVFGIAGATGITLSTTSGSPITLPGGGGFLAKYNLSGVLLWAYAHPGTLVDMAYAGSSGCLYTIAVDAANPNKTRIRSVNGSTGAILYDVLSTNTGISTANKGIAADGSGNCYILVEGRTDFKLPSSPSTIVIPSGNQDMVLMKLDATLSELSNKVIGNPLNSNESLKDIDCSPAGDLYITGSYENGMINLDPASTSYTLSNVGGRDLFLAKYTNNLAPVWATKIAGTGGDFPIAMSLDPNSHPFLLVQNKQNNSVTVEPCTLSPYTSAALSFDNKWYMVKYLPTGVIDWTAAPLVMAPSALPVAVHGLNGSARILGYSSQETDFGSYPVYGSGAIYLAKVSKIACKPGVATGIEEGELENVLNVYPNPAKGEFIIPVTGDDVNVSVNLVDNMGKQVLNLNNVKTGKVNIEHLANGIYFYTIYKNGNAYRGKIVKE